MPPSSPNDDRLAFEPARSRFEFEDAEQRGDVTVIRRVRERTSGKTYGIERPLPELEDGGDSAAVFAGLADSRSQLRHPHILEHFDVARDDESPYSVVEWAAGGTLAERLVRRGPLGEHELLKVANSVASALEFAAERSVHHGGVVPENLCLTADGSVKVAGFGFDAFRAQSRSKKPGVNVDESNDVSELCRTLYRLATAAERIERDRLDRLPPWLHEILGRGLSEIRAARFSRAHDFLEELRRLRQLSSGPTPRSLRREEPNFPTLELSPSDPYSESPSASAGRESGGESGSKDQGQRAPSGSSGRSGSKGSGGSGKRGSGDEFPWRPIEDQYELIGTPKQGGMGAVFQAREIATGRSVAIKRMKPGGPIDADALRRFHREAASVAKLNHPHVLQLLQVGRDADGDYLVLEWASGGSLVEQLNTKGKLTLRETLLLARKIGGALSYAHGKGCIHRDIKPHNILISDSGEPKLADFGLARTLGDDTLTSSGGGAGSMHYMAPEQGDDARHADERSDLYSFAKTLYHAATGKKPLMVDPRLLPPPLRKPLLKCLNDKPADRYPTVAAFLADLSHLDDRGVSGARAWRIAAGIAVVAALGLAGKIALDRGGHSARQPAPIEEPKTQPALQESPDERQDEPAPKIDAPKQTPPAPETKHDEIPKKSTSEPEPPVVAKPPPAEIEAEKPKDDPALVKRYDDADATAAARLLAWDDLTDANKPGSRALAENPDHRVAVGDLATAREAREKGDLDGAVAVAERAAAEAKRGFGKANADFLRDAISARLAEARDEDGAASVVRALAELKSYVPEFVASDEYDALQTRANEWAEPLKAAAPTKSEPEPEAPKTVDTPPDSPPAKAPPEPQEPQDPWARAIVAIAKNPAYHGLILKTEDGLAPLRADPRSGLYEFLVAATGDPPSIAANGSYELSENTGVILVLVPGGKLREGASPRASTNPNEPTLNVDPDAQRSEQPEHDVVLAPFFLAKYELSSAQWKRFGGKLSSGVADGAKAPVHGMPWAEASTLLAKVGLRLPTEAQWEWACRAGARSPWPYGSDGDSLRAAANLRFASKGAPPPETLFEIGSLAPNAFGLHDVIGNVAEYCLDPWTGNHEKATHRAVDGYREDGSGPYRVFRGGCMRDDPRRARSAARDFCPMDNPSLKNSVIGLRPERPILKR